MTKTDAAAIIIFLLRIDSSSSYHNIVSVWWRISIKVIIVFNHIYISSRGGRDHMVVGFTTITNVVSSNLIHGSDSTKVVIIPLQWSCRGVYWFHHVRPSRQILCRMITWVMFLWMFWNFISSLLVKRGGSLSFLTIFTFAVPELLDLIWRKIGFLPYVIW